MLRTVIIDDETHNRDTLSKLLVKYCKQVMVVGEAVGVKDGLTAIKQLHPDLILLDINMADGTGFDLLHDIKNIDFKVIFVSSFDKNMILAFKLSNIAYLQKPVSHVDLCEAVKYVEEVQSGEMNLMLKALDVNVRKYR